MMQNPRRIRMLLSAFLMTAVIAMPTVALAGVAAPVVPEDGDAGRGQFFYDEVNDRYYEVVLFGVGDDRSWPAARAAAEARTIFGGAYRGYLATLTTQSLNAYVVAEMPDGLWIGASDVDVEGEWFWVTGPSAGQQFWSGGPASAVPAGSPAPAGAFAAWQANEPNNLQVSSGPLEIPEHYAIANHNCAVRICTATSSWNDAAGSVDANVPVYVAGYLVAYSLVPVSQPGTLALTCTPDPVAVGGTVTCDVTGGDASIDILWRAACDAPFDGRGVTLDDQGRGTFTFVAPAGSAGCTIDVELVSWNVATTVRVVGTVVPTGIPAGPQLSATTVAPALLSLLALLAVTVPLVRRLARQHG
jgi:hypothetical protein